MITTEQSTELDAMRAEIDALDERIASAVRARIDVCRRIAAHKARHGLPMMDPRRLAHVRSRAEAFAAEHGLDAAFLARLSEVITDETCRIEDELMGTPAVGAGGLAARALRIDHVAVAVPDLDAALASLCDDYGFEVIERRDVAGEYSGMRSATLRAGGVTLVICQGDNPASNVSQFVAHHGPGVQHIAIAVRDQEELLEDLGERGAQLLAGIFRGDGLTQSFTKRDGRTGLQLEFLVRGDNDAFDDGNVAELFAAMEREGVY